MNISENWQGHTSLKFIAIFQERHFLNITQKEINVL